MKIKDNTPGDLISREALIKWIDESLQLYSSQYSTDMLNMFGLFREIINNAPTVEERQQGEWIKWSFKTFGALGDWEYKCSKCEKVYGGEYNFCPNCGADMRKSEKKVQTPSCLTDPDRHDELLERYKEGGAE